MKNIKWTMNSGNVVILTVNQDMPSPDYSAVAEFANENRLRHALSVLNKTMVTKGIKALPELCELRVTKEGKVFKLWAYTRNFTGYASYLAGILVGRRSMWVKTRRRHKKRRTRLARKRASAAGK